MNGTGFFVRIIVSQSQQLVQILPSLLNRFQTTKEQLLVHFQTVNAILHC